jgi:hypothetical protein
MLLHDLMSSSPCQVPSFSVVSANYIGHCLTKEPEASKQPVDQYISIQCSIESGKMSSGHRAVQGLTKYGYRLAMDASQDWKRVSTRAGARAISTAIAQCTSVTPSYEGTAGEGTRSHRDGPRSWHSANSESNTPCFRSTPYLRYTSRKRAGQHSQS